MEPTPAGAAAAGVAQGDTDDESSRLDSAATWLAGSFSVVTAVLTAIGATGGTLERMLRNHSIQARWGFGLVAAAIAAAGFSKSFFVSDPTFERLKRWTLTRDRVWPAVHFLVGGSQETLQKRLLFVGSAFFALGLFLVTDAAARTPADDEKPAISAEFQTTEGRLALHATVRAGGLRSTSVIHVVATGLSRQTTHEGETIVSTRLYESRSGPDSSGVVNTTLDVPLPTGVFDHVAVVAAPHDAVDEAVQCTTARDATREGCLVLKAPDVPDRPQVTASWDTAHADPLIQLSVISEGLRRSNAVAIVLSAVRPTGTSRILYEAVLAPNASGHLEQMLMIPLPAKVRVVCAAAMTIEMEQQDRIPRCPPDSTPQTTWARLTNPAHGNGD